MKTVLVTIALCLSAVGQAIFSGAGQYSGGAVYGLAAACGPPNYCAYGGQEIVAEADPLPNLASDSTGLYNNNATVQDTSYAAFGQTQFSPYIRCTDANSAPGNQNTSFSAGLGGSRMGILFNSNDTLIRLVAASGGNPITYFHPVAMKCGDPVTGAIITKGKNTASLNPSNTATQDFGGGEFSRTNPNLWYAYGKTADVTVGTQVTPYTISTTAGHEGEFTVGSTLTDFAYGLPLGANIAEWQSSHSYAYGAYVQHTLVADTEYLTAAALWPNKALVQGDLTVSPGGCGFKVIVAGTTGSSNLLPSSATCNWNNVTDGSVTWKGIGGPLVFSYQLTAPGGGGSSGGSAPAWVAGQHPDFNATVSDGSLTWTNTGPVQSPQWIAWSGTSRDGTKFLSAFSSNAYGLPRSMPSGMPTKAPGSTCWSMTRALKSITCSTH